MDDMLYVHLYTIRWLLTTTIATHLKPTKQERLVLLQRSCNINAIICSRRILVPHHGTRTRHIAHVQAEAWHTLTQATSCSCSRRCMHAACAPSACCGSACAELLCILVSLS